MYMWALMKANGNVYKDNTGYWKDAFDVHAVFETRKAAREYAQLFNKSHGEFVKVIQVLKGD